MIWSRVTRADGRRDRGAGAVEYLGVIALVASIVTALSFANVGPMISSAIQEQICKLTQNGCGGRYDRPKPDCEIYARDTSIGLEATAFSVVVGHSDKATLTKKGDGTAEVTLSDTYKIGGEIAAGAKLDFNQIQDGLKAAGYAGGSLTGSATVGAVYQFDSHQRAENFSNETRGGARQAVNFILGPTGDLAEQGIRGVKRVWNDIMGNEDGDDARTPDALVVDLSLQAQGDAGYGAGPIAGIGGQLKLAGGGQLKVNLSDQARKDGVRHEFQGYLTGGLSGNAQLLPFGGSLGIAGKVAYTVKSDKDGNPLEVTFLGEGDFTKSYNPEMNGLPVGSRKGGYGDFGVKVEDGTRWTRSYTLNLRNPENRTAFDQAFLHAGPLAVPKVTNDPAAQAANLTPLVTRLRTDAVYVQAKYDLSNGGANLGGGTDPNRAVSVRGGEGLAFGLGGDWSTGTTKLIEARSKDLSSPGSPLAPLQTCGKK